MKKSKNILITSILFILSILLIIIAIINNKRIIDVTDISLNYENVTLKYGDILKINATVSPSNATDKSLTWESSNPNLVSVDSDGNISIKENKDGNVLITVKSKNGKSDNVIVNVEKINTIVKVESVNIKENSISIKYGESKKINATVSPSNATDKSLTWESSNTSLVSVDSDGNISIKENKDGNVLITVKSKNGKSDNVTVNVEKVNSIIQVESVNIKENSISIKYGESKKINATVSPSNATDKSLTWESSNTSLVSVDSDGNISIKENKDGSALITVKSKNGKSDNITVSVLKKEIKVTGISFTNDNKTIYINSNNSNVNLTATITPSNATNKKITWSSSNTSIATVDSNGNVTPKKPGIANIIVTTEDGNYSDTFKLTVKKKVIIVIGASQVLRMKWWAKTYKSDLYNYSYKESDNNSTLNYFYESGSGFDYQVGTGWNNAESLMNTYFSNKEYTEFHVFFPLIGNSIQNFTCDEISSNNTTIKNIVNEYNKLIANKKSNGYNIQGYVVSMHPVVVTGKNSLVVENEDINSCAKTYRSNLKYYTFNKAVKSIVAGNYSSNLIYEQLFVKIMQVNSEGKNYTYKLTYNTIDDGVHWDQDTTKMYVKMMLDYSGNL